MLHFCSVRANVHSYMQQVELCSIFGLVEMCRITDEKMDLEATLNNV